MTVPLTALVVVRDEAMILRRCLTPLTSCDELLVIDLESSDGSADVARHFGARVITHPPVAAAEHVLPQASALSTNPWIIRVDPDESVPLGLLAKVKKLITTPRVGIVDVPIRHLFKGDPLSSSVWGGVRYQPRVFHRDRVDMHGSTRFHLPPVETSANWERAHIAASTDTTIDHHWVEGYKDFVVKHRRYVQLEAAADHAEGLRVSLGGVGLRSLGAFKRSFLTAKGWQGGIRGWALSILYGWYVGNTQWLLWRMGRADRRGQATERPR